MYRFALALLLVTIAIAGCSSGGGSAAAGGFSDASLNGRCIWRATGVPTSVGIQAGKGPFTIDSAAVFDGRGGLTMDYRVNLDGVYTEIPNLTGSYQVDPDGHGTFTYTSSASGLTLTFDFFITPDAKAIRTIYRSNTTDSVTNRVSWGACQFAS